MISPGDSGANLLELRNVNKVFGDRPVLKSIGMHLAQGSIHGLVGNNGAGKSTLVKIVTGTYSAASGSHVSINGRVAEQGFNEHTAREYGVRVVHQEAPLIDSFTVSEMVAVLSGYPTRLGFVNWRELKRTTRRLLARFDIKVEPDARAAYLSAAERALVTLAIALADIKEGGLPPLVILDEATASVPTEDARTYLEAVRAIAASGGAVLMISHRLNEVVEYCDAVTVLNDGTVIHEGTTEGLSAQRISELMANVADEKPDGIPRLASRSLPGSWGFGAFKSAQQSHSRTDLLKVSDLCGPLVKGVTFSIKAGEVVGLSGLFGSGVSQVARLIAGVETATRGTVELNGRHAFAPGSVHQALRAGIVYLSDNKAREGGISSLSLRENLVLPTVNRYWGKGSQERARVAEAFSLLEIRPPVPELPFGLLSGGNQQKVLLAKLLLTCPRLIVLDDPTVGVDPQSREILFSVLREFVQDRRAALVTSSEPDQLARVCDRVLIIGDGRVVRELRGPEVSAAEIALASA